MVIKDKKYGKFDVYLGDDGTLDTVIAVTPLDSVIMQNEEREIRFGDTSHHRDSETGAMTEDGFAELAEEAVEAYIEQYLI